MFLTHPESRHLKFGDIDSHGRSDRSMQLIIILILTKMYHAVHYWVQSTGLQFNMVSVRFCSKLQFPTKNQLYFKIFCLIHSYVLVLVAFLNALSCDSLVQ